MSRRADPLFPLIRHLSVNVTPLLARLPVSANQITSASLGFGLAAAGCLVWGEWEWTLVGAWLLLMGYVLDNCDGEIARLKNQCSEFGKNFDSFVDWLVHAAFFAALGAGTATATGEDLWLWLGGIAAVGCTVNYLVGFVIAARDRRAKENQPPASGDGEGSPLKPRTWKEWAIFILRELSRADFCFIVLVLAAFDQTWVLLPAGAVGSQVYWLTQFTRGASEYHV